MNQTFERYSTVMDELSAEPNYKTVSDIMFILEQKGFSVEKRTVQRTLQDINDIYGLAFVDMPITRGKPERGWAWPRRTGRPEFGPSEIDPPRALTLQLSAELLQPILPEEYLTDVKKTLAKKAREILSRASVSTLPQKVKVFPRGKGRLPAVVEPKILNTILDAVLEEKRVRVKYAPANREDGSESEYDINPLGLIFRFDTFYVVHLPEPEDGNVDRNIVMEWPLQRFRSASKLNMKIRKPEAFDLDEHLRAPGFTQNQANELRKLESKVTLKLLFNKAAARYVVERPFGENQTVIPQKDGRVLVTTTVALNRDVISELFNFADDVEVKAPKALKEYFIGISERLYKQYHPD